MKINKLLKKNIYRVLYASATTLLILPKAALAQDPTSIKDAFDKLRDTSSSAGLVTGKTVTGIITQVINWVLTISAVIAVGVIIWAGISYITSLGNQEKAEKAKRILLFAIVGVVIILLAFVVINTIRIVLSGGS